MKKILISSIFCLTVLSSAVAASVSGDTAKIAVNNWLARRAQLGARLGNCVASTYSYQTNGASFHVVKIQGGGFVVTSADTEIEPIVAFSESDDLVASEKNPLWVLLTRDLSSRARQPLQAATSSQMSSVALSSAAAKWAKLTAGLSSTTNGLLQSVQYATGLETVSDVRVAPLLQTLWSQQQDAYYSNQGSPCYNYYTPNNYPCGCVATAGAQIMRYHCFPTGSVTPVSRTCEVETGKDWISEYSYYPIYTKYTYTMQGGVYAWADMPLVPADGTTLEQRQAIGKLTSDIGISCYMKYGEDGSAAGGYLLAPAFKNVFGYANALPLQYSGDCGASIWKAAMLPNFDAKLPVEVSLDGPSGGHAVVADGYGYSYSTLYIHFNMGWAGSGNAWYAPPEVDDFTVVDGFVCNIYPSGAANGVICSGRVLSIAGDPVVGAMVSAGGSTGAKTSCLTDDKGIYALILSAGTHTLTATKDSSSATLSVSLSANVAIRLADGGTGYYTSPSPQVNNRYDQNFELEIAIPPPEPEQFTVTFNANGGTCLETTRRIVAEAVVGTLPMVTAPVGYVFVGWYTSPIAGDEVNAATKINEDVTFYAQWSPIQYILRFHDGYSTGAVDQYVSYDSPYVLGTQGFTRSGYLFSGWSTTLGGLVIYAEDAEVVKLASLQGDVVHLYAVWTAVQPTVYTLLFNGNGGVCSTNSIQVTAENTFGDALEEVTANRTGYTLDGWYTAASGGHKLYDFNLITSSATYYAHWTPITYQICFHDGYGTGQGWQYLTYDVATQLNPVPFIRSGYNFVGWSTSFGGPAIYEDGESILNLASTQGMTVEFYAVWEENMPQPCVLTFSANGGYCGTISSATPAGSPAGSMPEATRSGYLFDGWFTLPSGGVEITSETILNESMTLYAHWVPIATLSLAEAVDCTNLTFITGGDAPWYVVDGSYFNDGIAARSGKIGANQTSWIETTVQGPGELSFWVRGSSESQEKDYLELTVDGVAQDAKFGGLDGNSSSWSCSWNYVGVHTLRWTYWKDGEGDGGDDCGWLDHVCWTPDSDAGDDSGGDDPGGDDPIEDDGYGLPPDKGATYNGCLLDDNEMVDGTFSLVIKAPKKGTVVGEAMMTVVDASSGKKLKYAGGVDFSTGFGVANTKGKNDFNGLRIGSEEIFGSFKSWYLFGGVDAAKAKNTSLLNVMNGLNKRTYGVALFDEDNNYTTLAVAVSTKGKCKISGALPNGTKISASAQMFVCDCTGCVPILYTKKGVAVSCLLWIDLETKQINGISSCNPSWGCEYGSADKLSSGQYLVWMDKARVGACVQNYITETPFEIAVDFNGKKFNAGKSAKITYKKGTLTVGEGNVSGLTLSISKGIVKGSMTIYGITNGKLTKTKFAIAGVVVGESSAVCMATNKKAGSFPIYISQE